MKPKHIQLRRKKGYKMPPNTVKVDRSTPWGNPFEVGKHGTAEECVYKHLLLLSGKISITEGNFKEQEAHLEYVKANKHQLKGKNLACWCRLDKPCHRNTLLLLANSDGKLHIDDEMISMIMAKKALKI